MKNGNLTRYEWRCRNCGDLLGIAEDGTIEITVEEQKYWTWSWVKVRCQCGTCSSLTLANTGQPIERPLTDSEFKELEL